MHNLTAAWSPPSIEAVAVYPQILWTKWRATTGVVKKRNAGDGLHYGSRQNAAADFLRSHRLRSNVARESVPRYRLRPASGGDCAHGCDGNEMVEYSVATRFARVYQVYRYPNALNRVRCAEAHPMADGNSYRRSAIHGRQNLMSGINARPTTG